MESFFIREVLFSRIGDPERVDLVTRQNDTPMVRFIDIAEYPTDRQIELYWIDGGVPGHFAMRRGKKLLVFFHSRQVELCAHLRSILISEQWNRETRQVLFEGAVLRIIAEFLLQRGFANHALFTLAKSRTLQTGFFFAELDINQLEYIPFDERYLVEWFFGLGHEIGHAVGPPLRAIISSLDVLEPSRISEVVDTVIELRMSAKARKILRQIIKQSENGELPRSHASPTVILEEAVSDLFSVLCMCRAFDLICANQIGRELDPHLLVTEAIISMMSVMVIEQCRMMAGWFSTMQDELESQPFILSGIALQARTNLMVQTLGNAESRARLCNSMPGLGSLAKIQEAALSAMMNTLAERSEELTPAMTRAREFLSSAEMRDEDMFYDYLDLVKTDFVVRLDAMRFLSVARSHKVTSPALDLIRDAVASK